MRMTLSFTGRRWLLAVAAVAWAVSMAAAPHDSDTSNNTTVTAPKPEIPGALRIGDIEFQVTMQPFPDTYVGMTHFDTRTVQIDPSSAAEMRRTVYLHELMHIAWHEGRPAADKSRMYTEEEAIQALAPGLLKILEENPQAVEYLRVPNSWRRDKQLPRTTASK